MSKKKILEQCDNLLKQLNDLKDMLKNLEVKEEPVCVSVRNTDTYFVKKIEEKYPYGKILNAYGDIFYIDDYVLDSYTKGFSRFNDIIYTGRRILWNLELSKEKYQIRQIPVTDEDDNYDLPDYEVECIGVKNV